MASTQQIILKRITENANRLVTAVFDVESTFDENAAEDITLMRDDELDKLVLVWGRVFCRSYGTWNTGTVMSLLDYHFYDPTDSTELGPWRLSELFSHTADAIDNSAVIGQMTTTTSNTILHYHSDGDMFPPSITAPADWLPALFYRTIMSGIGTDVVTHRALINLVFRDIGV